jgi:hypothetical protein
MCQQAGTGAEIIIIIITSIVDQCLIDHGPKGDMRVSYSMCNCYGTHLNIIIQNAQTPMLLCLY